MINALLSACLLAACVSVLAGCGSTSPAKPRATRARTQPTTTSSSAASPVSPASRVDAIVSKMSLAEQAGQLVMTKIDGQSLSAGAAGVIAAQHLGNVILFTSNYRTDTQMQALTAALQRVGARANGAHLGMLVAIDQEAGAARRLVDLPPALGEPAEAQSRSTSEVQRQWQAAGKDLAQIGINLNLAPVADLDLPPAHVMGSRSFGSDASQAARYVTAAVRGEQAGGIAGTVKHFPGFGGASANSDFGVAHVARTRAQLLSHDILPFRAAIQAGVDAVMVSHGIYRGFGAHLPASIGPAVVGPILRGRLHFHGVVMSDSLNAKGLRGALPAGMTVPQACAMAVHNGIDIALVTGSLETARLCKQRIQAAARSGTISSQRLATAVRHVVALKLRLGLAMS